MDNSTKNFLEFNGRSLYFMAQDGTNWIAIKPICEALNIDYHRQQRNIREDDILFELCANQHMVAADNKLRNMFSMPEMYVYGWLFSIKSDSEELKKYKLQCYDLLYNYFHGAMTARLSELRVKTEAELRVEQLEAALLESPQYLELEAAKEKIKTQNKILKKLDTDLQKGQASLFGPPILN